MWTWNFSEWLLERCRDAFRVPLRRDIDAAFSAHVWRDIGLVRRQQETGTGPWRIVSDNGHPVPRLWHVP